MGEKEMNEILDDDAVSFKCFVCLAGDESKIKSKFPVYQKLRDATKKYTEMQEDIRAKTLEDDIKDDLKSKKRTKKFKCFSCFEVQDFTAKTKINLHEKFNTAV